MHSMSDPSRFYARVPEPWAGVTGRGSSLQAASAAADCDQSSGSSATLPAGLGAARFTVETRALELEGVRERVARVRGGGHQRGSAGC
ncbi:hypothetical protein OV079_03090 [Nannocystis pusilla]|uniref:Uncharacterized protein n=1 Tax=Nannocystis pusilla TaxID=889268 RepID=A0A9X3IUN9_9BACT|nr:hypothetical protein [Nannocystis pusilla]MCY1004571.1 hypothetical protein [Nannocystis pusilla]